MADSRALRGLILGQQSSRMSTVPGLPGPFPRQRCGRTTNLARRPGRILGFSATDRLGDRVFRRHPGPADSRSRGRWLNQLAGSEVLGSTGLREHCPKPKVSRSTPTPNAVCGGRRLSTDILPVEMGGCANIPGPGTTSTFDTVSIVTRQGKRARDVRPPLPGGDAFRPNQKLPQTHHSRRPARGRSGRPWTSPCRKNEILGPAALLAQAQWRTCATTLWRCSPTAGPGAEQAGVVDPGSDTKYEFGGIDSSFFQTGKSPDRPDEIHTPGPAALLRSPEAIPEGGFARRLPGQATTGARTRISCANWGGVARLRSLQKDRCPKSRPRRRLARGRGGSTSEAYENITGGALALHDPTNSACRGDPAKKPGARLSLSLEGSRDRCALPA